MYAQVFGIEVFENLVRFYLNRNDVAFTDYVYRYTQKAFSFSIHIENGRKMIVYPREQDYVKRKFFIDCLVTNYNKTRQDGKIQSINYEKPLWLEFVDNPYLPVTAVIYIRFFSDRAHLRVYNPNDTLEEFLSELTPKALKLKTAQQIKLKINDAKAFYKFEEWLKRARSEKITRLVYNEEEFVKMSARYKKKTKFDWSTPVNNTHALKEHFKTLESKASENFSAIQRKYRILVKKYHPDNVYGKDEATVKSYTEKFRQVQNAFDAIRAYYEKAS